MIKYIIYIFFFQLKLTLFYGWQGRKWGRQIIQHDGPLENNKSNSHIYPVTQTFSEIKLDKDLFSKSFKTAVKPGKACEPDNITSRDLKLYKSASIDSLYKFTVFHTSVTSGSFPDKLKTAKVSCIYKKGLEARLLKLQTDLSFEHSEQSSWTIHMFNTEWPPWNP